MLNIFTYLAVAASHPALAGFGCKETCRLGRGAQGKVLREYKHSCMQMGQCMNVCVHLESNPHTKTMHLRKQAARRFVALGVLSIL